MGRCRVAKRSRTSPARLLDCGAGAREGGERSHGRAGDGGAGARLRAARCWLPVVAGGETSGICVQALNIRQMKIGPQIDPGVPWCYATSAGGWTPPCLEIRQLRIAGLFLQSLCLRGMTMNELELSRRLSGRPLSLRARLYSSTWGNISVRLPDGFLISARTEACLGFLKPEALSKVGAEGYDWR